MHTSIDRTIRVAVFVALIFVALGVYLPFFPLILKEKGFSDSAVGLMLAVSVLAKVWMTPLLVANIAWLGERKIGTFFYAVFTCLTFSTLMWTSQPWFVFAVLIVFGAFWYTLIPLSDTYSLTEVRFYGANYGHIRLWGSFAFILGNLAAGFLLEGAERTSIHSLIALLLVLIVLWCLFLPRQPKENGEGSRISEKIIAAAASAPALKRNLWLVIGVASLVQASHALLYGFGTLHWLGLGLTSGEVGVLWATGVVAEIIVFVVSARLLSKFTPKGLLLLGAFAAMVRWGVHAHIEDFWLFVCLQILHGLTFGAVHLGLQSYIAETVSEKQTPKVQAGVVFVSGLLVAGLTLMSGALFEMNADYAFYTMAMVAGLALLFLALGSAIYPHNKLDGG